MQEARQGATPYEILAEKTPLMHWLSSHVHGAIVYNQSVSRWRTPWPRLSLHQHQSITTIDPETNLNYCHPMTISQHTNIYPQGTP